MARYILRYQDAPQAPASDLDKIRQHPNLKVVDQSPRMALVEGDEQDAHALAGALHGWTVSSETMTPQPDARQRIKA